MALAPQLPMFLFASLPSLHCVPLCWLWSPPSEFHWAGTGSDERCSLARAGCLGCWEREQGGPGSLWRCSLSLPVGGNMACQNIPLAGPGFLSSRWGLDSLWAPCHGSEPRLVLAEPRIIQELVFFFFILSTNQSTAGSVSKF